MNSFLPWAGANSPAVFRCSVLGCRVSASSVVLHGVLRTFLGRRPRAEKAQGPANPNAIVPLDFPSDSLVLSDASPSTRPSGPPAASSHCAPSGLLLKAMGTDPLVRKTDFFQHLSEFMRNVASAFLRPDQAHASLSRSGLLPAFRSPTPWSYKIVLAKDKLDARRARHGHVLVGHPSGHFSVPQELMLAGVLDFGLFLPGRSRRFNEKSQAHA